MKTTAIFTSMLAALTPAVVGQVQVQSFGSLGTEQITIYSHSEGVNRIFSTTAPTTCENSPFGGPVNATTIEITERKVPIKCTFYTGHECSGQNYTLGAGKHDLEKRPLLVDSFKCAQNGTTTNN
ncbi:hypothetical protein ASPSYDRAFT_34784 [Aspergillus sydowii CBS 593.65]|uniref:AA1-like domain-containing protein n=1 Tax=Aspergillus sydowii CBS 593.65 TaxID=1036612 RepID=A0A1L9T6G5_9EURO|nr:uncharacterized protein ASPSYDRAFT_34784 [Aspergillus sydowii CBS 593.65]OJJ54965.1 hypothetical protein ASPSYDRAFT_34784 [Aspergillus sydowii CBS 593.65]